MATKKRSFKGKKQYGVYKTEGRYDKNRKARLARHLENHPNDSQAAKTKITYRRDRPKNLKKEPPAITLRKQPLDPRKTLTEQLEEVGLISLRKVAKSGKPVYTINV